MKKWILAVAFAFPISAFSQVTISPYTLCKTQQDKMLDQTMDQSTPCKRKLSDAARCCVGATRGCAVPGKTVTPGSGANGLAQSNIQGDQFNVAGIKAMKDKCGDAEKETIQPCSAPADKAERQKYLKLDRELNTCLDAESAASAKRITDAGQTLYKAQDNPCNRTQAQTAEQILECLKAK